MKNSLEIKKELFKNCSHFCDNRLLTITTHIEEISMALTSETKSSAGDKHETGRAMLQLEREKLGNQLAQVQKLQQTLSKIDIARQNAVVGLGSLVYTTKTNYFMAISAGEIRVKDQLFYAITPITPIGLLLMGKHVGDGIHFKEQQSVIEFIF